MKKTYVYSEHSSTMLGIFFISLYHIFALQRDHIVAKGLFLTDKWIQTFQPSQCSKAAIIREEIIPAICTMAW